MLPLPAAVLRTLPLLLVVASAACVGDATAPLAIVSDVRVEAADHPLVRTAVVTLDRPGDIVLRWSAPGAPELVMESAQEAERHEIVLPRLRPDRRYTLHVGTPHAAAERTVEFDTGALPEDVAGIRFQTSGRPTHDVALVEVVTATSGFLGALLVEDGEVVWYHRTGGSLFGTTRRANGDLVLLDPALGLVVIDGAGRPVHRLAQPDSPAPTPYGRIHHDVLATPHNTLLFIANETRTLRDTLVIGEALWEWSPESGAVTRRWSAFEHLDWTRDRTPRADPGNWLHGNGLAWGARGNVLFSARNIDQVLSISPDYSRVEWRLGGPGATLSLAAGDRFFGQHGISEPAPGRLLLFDNGWERPGERFSRAVEYAVDAGTGTAARTWQFRPAPDIYAALVGSAQRLANGHTVALFGMQQGHNASTGPIVAIEVDPAGGERWRLAVTAGLSRLYRVTLLPAVRGEARR